MDSAERKKQTLTSLFESGRISKETFDAFYSELETTLQEIEIQKQALLEKMRNKIKELEEYVKILEKMLASFEIQWAGRELEEESYQRGMSVITLGLETAKKELNIIKEFINQLTAPKPVEQKHEEEHKENAEFEQVSEAREPAETVKEVEISEQISQENVETASSSESIEEKSSQNVPEDAIEITVVETEAAPQGEKADLEKTLPAESDETSNVETTVTEEPTIVEEPIEQVACDSISEESQDIVIETCETPRENLATGEPEHLKDTHIEKPKNEAQDMDISVNENNQS